MTIYGDNLDVNGTVTIGGVAATIVEWTPYRIKLTSPALLPSRYHEVVVYIDDDDCPYFWT